MKRKHKIIIGQIKYMVEDERQRLLNDDHIEWLERKFKEIKKLVNQLPYIKCEGNDRSGETIFIRIKQFLINILRETK